MQERYLKYNKELVKRFVSDYRLPIVMLQEKYFFYFLNLYQEKFQSLDKWIKLWNMIDKEFDGNEVKFLDYYYSTRDNIITTIEKSDAFQSFNTKDMSEYTITDKPNVTSNNIYNCENIGKCFLSIDLKKANFQALKYADSNIVLNADTYEEFIGRFTELEYIKESKYSRQVIFGKCNPKRHMTVEKYLTNKVWKLYQNYWFDDCNIVSISNDEIIIETKCELDNEYLLSERTYKIEKTIKNELGLEVRAEYFQLFGYQLESKDTGESRNTFFEKRNLINCNSDLICVPAPYHALVYKLFNNIPLEEPDYHFVYEGIDCRFMEEFKIKKL